MAESPFKITLSDDGLSVRCEFDAHYVSDEDAHRICGYIDQLQAENVELQDENARLRSCLSDDAENARMIMDENAKLRELAADMWRFTGAACKKYPRLFDPVAQGGQMVQLNAIDSFERRMRELGIEVDG